MNAPTALDQDWDDATEIEEVAAPRDTEPAPPPASAAELELGQLFDCVINITCPNTPTGRDCATCFRPGGAPVRA